jgi:peptidoglycan/xylan/chitin deacetylase (PgdA/CDA1 family)
MSEIASVGRPFHDFKQTVKRSLLLARMTRYVARVLPPSVALLRYHSVQEDPQKFDSSIGRGITHSAKEFDTHMKLVARHFRVITLDELVAFQENGSRLPRRSVVITFDDGYLDNYEIAAPILSKYGLRAAFYITGGSIGKGAVSPWFCRVRHAFRLASVDRWENPIDGKTWELRDVAQRRYAYLEACRHSASLSGSNQHAFVEVLESTLGAPACPSAEHLMMDWSHVRKLHEADHTIGSHTLTHPNVAFIDEEELRREVRESKAILERELSTKVLHFSYPSPILQPHWTQQTVAATKEAGYRTAVTCTAGPFLSGYSLLRIPRISAPHNLTDLHWELEISTARRPDFDRNDSSD